MSEAVECSSNLRHKYSINANKNYQYLYYMYFKLFSLIQTSKFLQISFGYSWKNCPEIRFNSIKNQKVFQLFQVINIR